MAEKSDEMVALRAMSLVTNVPLNAKRIMFAPAGVHHIYCGLGDKATAEMDVRVDKETTAVLQASLAALNAANKPRRAMLDQHHQGKDSMGQPLRFEWQDGPEAGPFLVVELSSLGAEYVAGKVLTAFS